MSVQYKIIHEKEAKTGIDWYIPAYSTGIIFKEWIPVVTKSPFPETYGWRQNVAFRSFQEALEAIKSHHMNQLDVIRTVEYEETTKERETDGTRK